jgi:hypothetical protein
MSISKVDLNDTFKIDEAKTLNTLFTPFSFLHLFLLCKNLSILSCHKHITTAAHTLHRLTIDDGVFFFT